MNWNDKKVLVTGCWGVIGRHLVRSLIEAGALVRGIDINNCPIVDKNFDFIQKDLLHLNPIDVLYLEPEIVFHLAAAFERSEERLEFWQNNYMNNLLASHQVIDALRYSESIKKLVFASSYLVYDSALYASEDKKSKPRLLKETDQKNPRNLTGATKYYAEKEIEFFYTNLPRKVQWVNARIYRVYGEGSKDIISRWVRAALKGETLNLYGKENSFDYVCASDVAQGLIRIAQTDYPGPVNLATGVSKTIADVVDCLKGNFKDIKVKEIKHKDHFEKSGADMKLFRSLTGWVPTTDIDQGIKNIIEYEKNS